MAKQSEHIPLGRLKLTCLIGSLEWRIVAGVKDEVVPGANSRFSLKFTTFSNKSCPGRISQGY